MAYFDTDRTLLTPEETCVVLKRSMPTLLRDWRQGRGTARVRLGWNFFSRLDDALADRAKRTKLVRHAATQTLWPSRSEESIDGQ